MSTYDKFRNKKTFLQIFYNISSIWWRILATFNYFRLLSLIHFDKTYALPKDMCLILKYIHAQILFLENKVLLNVTIANISRISHRATHYQDMFLLTTAFKHVVDSHSRRKSTDLCNIDQLINAMIAWSLDPHL